jgi:hypothetical protein
LKAISTRRYFLPPPRQLLIQATPPGHSPEASGVRRRKCAFIVSGASRRVYPHFSKPRLTLGQEGSALVVLVFFVFFVMKLSFVSFASFAVRLFTGGAG